MTVASLLRIGRDYALLTVGAICSALAVNLFLVPNNVVSGGVTGIAMIARSLFNTPVGILVLLLNIPLFILGWRSLGGFVFGVRTIYTVIVMSLAIDGLAPFLKPVTAEPLLFILYGGVLDGLGVGLVLRARGTTGGVDIVARLLERRYGLAPGQTILVADGLLFAGALWIYGAEPVLYALLVSFIATRTIDLVLEGTVSARQALIITDHPEAITAAVIAELSRGVTLLEGRGGYTSKQRAVLLCVVLRSELSFLKAIIGRIDPAAFVVIGNAAEALGEGFRPIRVPRSAPQVPPPLEPTQIASASDDQ